MTKFVVTRGFNLPGGLGTIPRLGFFSGEVFIEVYDMAAFVKITKRVPLEVDTSGVIEVDLLADGYNLSTWDSEDRIESMIVAIVGNTRNEIGIRYEKLVSLSDLTRRYFGTIYDNEPVVLSVQAKDSDIVQYAAIRRMSVKTSAPLLKRDFIQGGLLDGEAYDFVVSTIELEIERLEDGWRGSPPWSDSAIGQKWTQAINGRTYGVDDPNGTEFIPVWSANIENDQLTHVYRYDHGTTSYSSNLLDEAGEFDLFDASAQVNDAIYFGIESLTQLERLGNITVNITQAFVASSVTVQWESWQAGTDWIEVYVHDQTNAFQSTGLLSAIFSRHPYDDGARTVNGVNAFWVRCRITAISSPSQAARATSQIFQATNNFIDIPKRSVLAGDLGTQLNLSAKFLSIWNDPEDEGGVGLSRILAGARSLSRGADFRSKLNLAGRNNPTGIDVTYENDTASFTFDRSYDDGRAIIDPPGLGLEDRVIVSISGDALRQYTGTYRAFLTIGSDSPYVPTAWEFQVAIRNGSGNSLETETILPQFTTRGVFDLGKISISPDAFLPGESAAATTITIRAGRLEAGSSRIFLRTLELIPSDESISDIFSGPATGLTAYSAVGAGYTVYSDDKAPKVGSRALVLSNEGKITTTYIVAPENIRIKGHDAMRVFFCVLGAELNGEEFIRSHVMLKAKLSRVEVFDTISWAT